MKNGKWRRMIELVCLVVGVLCVLYGVAILAYAGFTVKFHLIWLVLGASLIGLSQVFKKVRLGMVVLPRWLVVWGSVFACVGIALFLFVEIILFTYACKEPKTEADVVLVLGCQVRGEKISRALQYRLQRATVYLKQHPDVIVVVSGGKGTGENISEADAMEHFLLEQGIEGDRIIKEDRSTSTVENVRFSRALLEQYVQQGDIQLRNKTVVDCHLVVVSNGFHMFRAIHICKKQGFNNVEGLAGSSDPYMAAAYYLREFFAVVKDFLFGNM